MEVRKNNDSKLMTIIIVI